MRGSCESGMRRPGHSLRAWTDESRIRTGSWASQCTTSPRSRHEFSTIPSPFAHALLPHPKSGAFFRNWCIGRLRKSIPTSWRRLNCTKNESLRHFFQETTLCASRDAPKAPKRATRAPFRSARTTARHITSQGAQDSRPDRDAGGPRLASYPRLISRWSTFVSTR